MNRVFPRTSHFYSIFRLKILHLSAFYELNLREKMQCPSKDKELIVSFTVLLISAVPHRINSSMLPYKGTWSNELTWVWFPVKYEARPSKRSLIKTTQALPFVKYCYQHYLIEKLIKKLFTLHCSLSLSSLAFQSLLITVITIQNWHKKNALACIKLVRK